MTNISNTTFYVGVTNNLARRTWEHKSNILPGFTEKYELHKLVYYECYEDETTAITREKYLKKCYRKTKEKLISEFNPMWNDLYDKISE